MKNQFRKGLLALVALAAAAFAVPARAQVDPIGETVSVLYADDESPAMICKYVGTSGKGYLTVAANGDVTFESVDSSTADTTIECPVSGAAGGIFDVSDTACDTFGEFVDLVNTSSSNFRCFLHGALRTDSTNDTLLAASDQDATSPGGYAPKFDTDVFLKQRFVVTPLINAPYYLLGRYMVNTNPSSSTINRNPWEGVRARIDTVYTLSTYGSGTSALKVYAVDVKNGLTGPSETVSTLWSEAAGATTVAKQFGGCDTPATACSVAWGPTGLFGYRNQKLLVSLENSAAMATTALAGNGKQFFNYSR